ncbi:MAG: 16S rRNA (guanine(527)-N(7))-methyltransferase RsmG [Rhodospirillaceae bacterium]|nr:16S rRNA (guanine(527)-N(7))-methyltransferase RsmG [Rhodospirillaceae bacterium]
MAAPLEAKGFWAITGISGETAERLKAYESLLRKWQKAINLVSNRSLEDVWRRHFLDSAQIFDALPRNPGSLLDIGSGAGFPGMVLAILGVPGVVLVESDHRKCQFLREVSRETSTDVTIFAGRIEALAPKIFDVVVSRACAPLNVLLKYAQPYLGPDTICIFLKGRAAPEELTTAEKHWIMRYSLIKSISDSAGMLVRLEGVTDGGIGDK